jgi:hypothetical protein
MIEPEPDYSFHPTRHSPPLIIVVQQRAFARVALKAGFIGSGYLDLSLGALHNPARSFPGCQSFEPNRDLLFRRTWRRGRLSVHSLAGE